VYPVVSLPWREARSGFQRSAVIATEVTNPAKPALHLIASTSRLFDLSLN